MLRAEQFREKVIQVAKNTNGYIYRISIDIYKTRNSQFAQRIVPAPIGLNSVLS